tara:strand:- start:1583 stop:1801 length:219 start_codon:yes stop_codon:yes gene_type:complete
MGKMKEISRLCENNDRNGLIAEIKNNTFLLQLSKYKIEEMADGFLKSHNEIRDNRNNPAFKKLNEIHDKYNK